MGSFTLGSVATEVTSLTTLRVPHLDVIDTALRPVPVGQRRKQIQLHAMSVNRQGVHGLAADFAEHRLLVGSSNPIVARELELLEALLCGHQANAGILDRLARAWRSRTFRAFYERPLLIAAALRHEALSIRNHPLAPALATEPPDPRALTLEGLAAALDPECLPIWLTLATRKVQTNDVSRAVAWRWPATVARGRPIVLVDVGCSAGLGLVADAVQIAWTDQDGRPLSRSTGEVAARIGFDAEPVDPLQPSEVEWLRACLWPGERDRQERFDEAIAAFARAAEYGPAPVVERVRAKHVPARLKRIERAADGSALVLVVQSFVREYLDASEAIPYVQDMQRWLAALPPGRAMWVQLELAAIRDEPRAEIVAQASSATPTRIGRCTVHPRSVIVDSEGFARLRAAVEAYPGA